MLDTCESTPSMARVIEMLTKELESMQKEISYLKEEIILVRARIPDCPCGNTMVSTIDEYHGFRGSITNG